MNVFSSFRRDQRGVTAIEYALIAAAMSFAFATAAIQFESNVKDNVVVSGGSMDLDTLSGFGNGNAASAGNSGGTDETAGAGDTGDTSGSGSSGSNNDDNGDNDDNGNNGGGNNGGGGGWSWPWSWPW